MRKYSYISKPLVAVACFFAAIGAANAALDSSAANALSGRFLNNGFSTTVAPVAPAIGTSPPGFDEWNRVPSYNQTLDIVESTAVNGWQPALLTSLSVAVDHATGSGIGIDSFGSEADSRINAADLALTELPPPDEPIAVEPALTISAKGVRSSATYSVTVPKTPVVVGTASFTKLTVSGPLVGNQVLTYEGTPPPNFVLYQNGGVTITLNRHQEEAIISCILPDGCKVTPVSVQVDAVAVSLNNAQLPNKTVSGEFVLGHAKAS